MKKETLILLALLGFGLYRNLKSRPKNVDKDKLVRKIHDSVKGDSQKAIPLISQELNVEMNEANQIYEIFMQKLAENPKFGL